MIARAHMIAGLVGLAVAAPVTAATYNAFADFPSAPGGVWSYGTGVTGSSFVADTEFHTNCEGTAGISCWQTPTPVSRVPFVAKNTTGSSIFTYGTVVMPTDVLNVHPGPSTDSIVRFTAPSAGSYRVTGFFELLDLYPNGVNVAVPGLSFASALTGPAATYPGTPGGRVNFSGIVHLAASGVIDFGVNNRDNFYNDSTGLSATIASVPEPSSWLMMIAGFGLVGTVSRRRKAAVFA